MRVCNFWQNLLLYVIKTISGVEFLGLGVLQVWGFLTTLEFREGAKLFKSKG